MGFARAQPILQEQQATFSEKEVSMFIAMNRFQVKKGSEQAFENVWSSRESYLGNMVGFVEFHLLRGPVADDHTL
jgi:heme-degrading monooxygenase HmoA